MARVRRRRSSTLFAALGALFGNITHYIQGVLPLCSPRVAEIICHAPAHEFICHVPSYDVMLMLHVLLKQTESSRNFISCSSDRQLSITLLYAIQDDGAFH